MMPARLPNFLYKLKYNLFPKYFLYSLIAATGESLTYNSKSKKLNIDKIFGKAAIKLIKVEKDRSNPYLLWACVILSAFHRKHFNTQEAEYLMHLQKTVVREFKFYKIDGLKSFKSLYNSEEIEFIRRVWWCRYILSTTTSIFTAWFQDIDERDVFVNLPTNDFKWRYGGFVNRCDPELSSINSFVNTNPDANYPPDNFSALLELHILFSKVSKFTSSRWIKKYRPRSQLDSRFHFLKSKLESFKSLMDKNYPESTLTGKIEEFNLFTGLSLVRNIDNFSFCYLINQLFRVIVIFLYQSELVRSESDVLSAERIKDAKLKCLNASIDMSKTFLWKCNEIPRKYWSYTITAWKMWSVCILINSCFILKSDSDEPKNPLYSCFINRYIETTKDIQIEPFIELYSQILYEMKKGEYIKYRNDALTHCLMSAYSITPNDLSPWIIPKYSSFIKFNCCFQSNYTSIDSKQYLFATSSDDSTTNESSS
ncbi:hypothetical protein AYI68_g5863 [Smittium mucronatum]|uniref:Transcription factor domain-containing protein n=1 Tax=Smittium mucronatum TaxID=133383 RepID=A0A1R0GT38_9FUNG|nr:hypothetical protein AYI68_g5863 [Smittium mucronatum]